MTGRVGRLLRFPRRLVGLHGNSVQNAGSAVRRDDAARAHREQMTTDIHDAHAKAGDRR